MVFVRLAVINILLVQGKLQTAWLQIVVFCIHSELSNMESKLRSYFSLRGQHHRAAEKCSLWPSCHFHLCYIHSNVQYLCYQVENFVVITFHFVYHLSLDNFKFYTEKSPFIVLDFSEFLVTDL